MVHCTLGRMGAAASPEERRPKFRRIALIGKLPSAGIAASLRELTDYLRQRGCEVLVEQHTAQALGVRGADYEALGKGSDLAVLVGKGTPEERTLLDAEILRGGTAVLRTIALNEAVLGKGAEARLIEFEVSLDGEYLYTLRADGLIVATPTGSTAYAMSAQGPILHPAVPAFALVPLNPHTLSARPVSVSDRSAIEIKLLRGVDVRAHFDGFSLTDMAEGDRLVLRRSADTVRFVHPPGYRYFATLREKLRWSEVLDKGRE